MARNGRGEFQGRGEKAAGTVRRSDADPGTADRRTLFKMTMKLSSPKSFIGDQTKVDSRLRQKSRRICPQGSILDGSDGALWRKKNAGMTVRRRGKWGLP